jgi:hypothetical protein
MHQCQRIKWSRFNERAKDEEKPFLEQLLQEGVSREDFVIIFRKRSDHSRLGFALLLFALSGRKLRQAEVLQLESLAIILTSPFCLSGEDEWRNLAS